MQKLHAQDCMLPNMSGSSYVPENIVYTSLTLRCQGAPSTIVYMCVCVCVCVCVCLCVCVGPVRCQEAPLNICSQGPFNINCYSVDIVINETPSSTG